MTALLSMLAAKAAPFVIAGGALLLSWLGFYVRGRLSGAKLERQKQDAAEAKARDIRDQVDNDVGALPADLARKELGKWSK